VSKENLSLVKSEKTELLEVVSPREIELVFDRRIEKRVPVISRLNIIPHEGFAAGADDSIAPANVTISGPADRISDLHHVETIEKTLDGIKDNITIRVPIKPPDIYGAVIHPDTVTVISRIIPVKMRTFSNLPIQLINTPSEPEYRIYPTQLEIKLAGSKEIIDNLNLSQVSVYADFRHLDKNGQIPIQTKVPPSISIISRSVDSVKIIKEEE
jgi:YbbR domain-containing protein